MLPTGPQYKVVDLNISRIGHAKNSYASTVKMMSP